MTARVYQRTPEQRAKMSLAQRKRWASHVPKERFRRKRPVKVPHLVEPDGSRALCEVPRRTGLLCLAIAAYPDRRCCLHTKFLDGQHHERKKLDTEESRRKAWQKAILR
jgi:hypothetical protein